MKKGTLCGFGNGSPGPAKRLSNGNGICGKQAFYLIKGQTALGKTSTYLNYMKDSVRPVVIAVPTHELKQQIFYDANLHGIEAICATPDITTYGISEEVTEEMQEFL